MSANPARRLFDPNAWPSARSFKQGHGFHGLARIPKNQTWMDRMDRNSFSILFFLTIHVPKLKNHHYKGS